MTLRLDRCDADALHRWGWTARGAGEGHATLESAARAMVRCFYDALEADGADGSVRACALVRCYKTHPFASLPADLQRLATQLIAPEERPAPATMPCVALLASAGDEPPWNSRHDAGVDAVIPLPTLESVARWPMLAQLVHDFGLEPADLVRPSSSIVHPRPRRGRNYGVFHVADALGHTTTAAEAALVERHGVRSIVGFGGLLSTGDLFAVLLYSRVSLTREVAEQFRTLALHVKSAFFAFGEHDAFDPTALPDGAMEAAF